MQILKIFVVGPFSSGKTTFIQALSEIGVVSTDRRPREEDPPPAALDFGRLTLSEQLVLYFFGHPSGIRVESTLEYFVRKGISLTLTGFVVMMDSRLRYGEDGDDFPDRQDRYFLTYAQNLGYPCVVALSRQDLPDVRTPQEMRAMLSVSDDVKVLGYDRNRPVTAKQVVLELLEICTQDEDVQKAIKGLKARIEEA